MRENSACEYMISSENSEYDHDSYIGPSEDEYIARVFLIVANMHHKHGNKTKNTEYYE